jgi:uncharacterized membrane protein YqjE
MGEVVRTRETEGVGTAAKEVAQHASQIARLELSLALIELKEKVAALARGIVLALVGAVLGLFGLGLAAATIAAALATAMSTWLALLIVTAAFFVLAGVLVGVGLGGIKRGTPPVPTEAIQEARLTTEAVKGNGSRRDA